MEYYSAELWILKGTCTSLKWIGPIYDIFSSVRLIGQTNSHLYKIAHYKNTASNFLDYIAKVVFRCNKKEWFLHGRFWSRARQRDVLRSNFIWTDKELFSLYFERLAVNGWNRKKFRTAGCERLWKNFEWNEFSDRKRTKPKNKHAPYVNNQPQVLVH